MTSNCVYSGWVSSVSLLALVNNSEVAVASAAVTDMAVKVPTHSVVPKTGPWTTSREPASLWGGDIDGKNVLSLPLVLHASKLYGISGVG